MDYGTLNGTTEALKTLADAIRDVKALCTEDVLAQTSDQWPKVQTYLQEAIDKIETAQANLPTTGASMQAIASKYGD